MTFFSNAKKKKKEGKRKEGHKSYSSTVKIRKPSIILMPSYAFLTNHLSRLNNMLVVTTCL
jgi:hypothetical protein